MQKIKIIILTCALKMGGAEKHIHDLVLNSDRIKFNFVIICLYELGAIGEVLSGYGVKVYHNVMRNRLDIFGVWKLHQIVRNEKADILFMVHTPLTLFWGVLCAKINTVKATLTRSPTTNPTAHVKRNTIVNFFVLRFVDKIVAQANSHREHQIKHGADQEKIVVINNGVDLELFSKPGDASTLKQAIKIPLDAQVVGIVARLEPQKGLHFFLMAAKNIISLLPKTHIVIVGDGSERRNLENMCRGLFIEQNVHFLGMIKNISEVVQMFDVGVLSSMPVGETFPNAVLEYMAASKPVVATNAGSTAEIVIDGRTGYIVPSGSPEALSDSLIKLLKNKDLAKKMGEAGRDRIKEKFVIQGMINKYETLFVSLLR
jgi:glycosyltransferase involved in cell wall biosynthesis